MFLISLKQKINKKIFLIFFIYLFIQTFKSLNFGIRHLLIIDLALIFYLSRYKQNIILLLATLILFSSNYPNFISFANPYVPHKELIISDSDLDWGQGLPAIKDFVLKEKISNYQLAYFGTDDPAKYLTNYINVTKKINLNQPIFISATCFQTCNFQNLDQLKKKSYTLIGGSILYFP